MQFELALEHQHHAKPPKEKAPDPAPLPPAGLPSFPRSPIANSQSQIFPVQQVFIDLKPAKPPIRSQELAVSISTDVSRIPANEILKDFLPESKRNLNGYLMKEIYNRKRLVEDRIYNSEISETREYLKHIYQTETDINRMERYFLEEMIKDRGVKVAGAIEAGDHSVQRKKIYNKEQLNDLVHYQQGELKSKLIDLRHSMKNSLFSADNDPTAAVFDDKYYSKDHPKTKQAQQFVKKLNQEKNQIRKKFAEARKKRHQAEQKSIKQEQESYRQHLSERHGKIKERYQIRQQLKVKEEQLRSKKLIEFQKFLKQYKLKKPLYAKKQQEFKQKVLSPMQEQYELKLAMIKDKYRPPNYEDLDEHQRRYMEYKRDNLIRKQQQMRVLAEAHKGGNNFFRGKYRLQVLQEMLTEKEVEDPRLIEKLKKVRQLVYSDNVKSRFVPRINEQKRRQMQQILEKSNQSKIVKRRPQDYKQFLGQNGSIFRSLVPADETAEIRSPQLDGRRNLQSLHRMIENYRRQGKIKKPRDQQRAVSVTIQPKTNYLQELRKKRQHQAKNSRYSDEYFESTRLDDVDEFQRLKIKADLIDQHAMRREKYMRVVKDDSLGGIQQGKNLEEDYLASIKAKMSLLSKNEFSI